MTDTGITATITPTASNSKILVLIAGLVYGNLQSGTTEQGIGAQLLRDATTILDYGTEVFRLFAHTSSTSFRLSSVNPVMYLDSPATTSAITYKLQARNASTAADPTMFWQYTNKPSTITLMEIGA